MPDWIEPHDHLRFSRRRAQGTVRALKRRRELLLSLAVAPQERQNVLREVRAINRKIERLRQRYGSR